MTHRAPSLSHAATPTLGQQHHPWHDDECQSQEFDNGESRLEPRAPGDAPGVEGEDHVWRESNTATTAACAQHTQGKIQQLSLP